MCWVLFGCPTMDVGLFLQCPPYSGVCTIPLIESSCCLVGVGGQTELIGFLGWSRSRWLQVVVVCVSASYPDSKLIRVLYSQYQILVIAIKRKKKKRNTWTSKFSIVIILHSKLWMLNLEGAKALDISRLATNLLQQRFTKDLPIRYKSTLIR